LRSLIEKRIPVHVRCRDGYEVSNAIIQAADTFGLLVTSPNGLELLYTHAVVSIAHATAGPVYFPARGVTMTRARRR
jgi:sRNA-binding regulator protein Hfq